MSLAALASGPMSSRRKCRSGEPDEFGLALMDMRTRYRADCEALNTGPNTPLSIREIVWRLLGRYLPSRRDGCDRHRRLLIVWRARVGLRVAGSTQIQLLTVVLEAFVWDEHSSVHDALRS